MRKTIFMCWLLALCAFPHIVSAQMLWPVKGLKTGEGIIYRPQDYINTELNFDNLFIAAKEGTEVVAPEDATVAYISLTYYNTLTNSMSYNNASNNFDGKRIEVAKEKPKYPVQYINGGITLRLSDGSKVHICGLRGDKKFHTGQKVKKGEVLGTVAYAYRKVNGAHISVSISTKDGKPSDPMTPFGLKSTYIKAKEVVPPQVLTEQQANEDLEVLLQVFKECYASYDDRMTPEKYDRFVAEAKKELKGTVKFETIHRVVSAAFSERFINDSHIALLTPSSRNTRATIFVPHLFLGYTDGKLMVTQVQKGLEQYLKKEVTAMDGKSAREIVDEVRKHITSYDVDVHSYKEMKLLEGWNFYVPNITTAQTHTLTFADGTTYKDVWIPATQVKGIVPSWMESKYRQQLFKEMAESYEFRLLNPQTALLTLASFTIDQAQMAAIADSIRLHANVPNMIIDLRNNPGGSAEVLDEMTAWFIERPYRLPSSFCKVNSNTTYKSFKYSENYPADNCPFEDFYPIEGRKGFYLLGTEKQLLPDSTLHYGGRLYLLINEYSTSAASELASRLVREGRAVTIGRETRTGYHYMTATKFVNIALPHSKIRFILPLMQIASGEAVTPRFPKDRGLLPDYEVPITYEEMMISKEDIILNHTLKLIEEGKYLK